MSNVYLVDLVERFCPHLPGAVAAGVVVAVSAPSFAAAKPASFPLLSGTAGSCSGSRCWGLGRGRRWARGWALLRSAGPDDAAKESTAVLGHAGFAGFSEASASVAMTLAHLEVEEVTESG